MPNCVFNQLDLLDPATPEHPVFQNTIFDAHGPDPRMDCTLLDKPAQI